jgi:hypothetical protein
MRPDAAAMRSAGRDPAASSDLASLQRFMQRFITDPRSDRHVVARDRTAARTLVLPSRSLAPEERLGIYRGMYLLRMYEALASDFQRLEALIGHEAFHRLVADYVAVHPSRSYSFEDLREHLPRFVAGWDPRPRAAVRRKPTARTVARLKRERVAASELASLERAIADAFQAPRAPVLTARQVKRVPAEAWSTARLVAVPSLRLLAFRRRVNEAFSSFVPGERLVIPPPKANWIAVYRRDDRVWRLPLTRPAFEVLSDLASGKSLGSTLRRAAMKRARVTPDLVQAWFRRWISEGIFSRVELRQGRGRRA